MKEQWSNTILDKVCDFSQGIQRDIKLQSSVKAQNQVRFLRIIDFTRGNEEPRFVDNPGEKYIVSKNDISMVRYGTIGFVCRGLEGAIANNLFQIKIKDETALSKDFLYHFLNSPLFQKPIQDSAKGVAMPAISFGLIKKIAINFPNRLIDQQAIVEKLDFAFDAIEKAKANIEKNIENTKELFQSKLNEIFSQKGEGWEEKKLSEVFKMKSGVNLTSKMMKPDGEFPVFGGNNIAGYYDEYNFEKGVIVGRVGALCGNVRFIDRKIWITDNAFKLTDFMYKLDFRFLTYLLNYKNLREYARQTAQPVISNSSLKDVILDFPHSLKEQEQIVSHLDLLSDQTNLLQEKYKQKLANLEELKKSILEKAFKGELV